MWPVLDIELEMALYVSPVSNPCVPMVTRGGDGTIESFEAGFADGDRLAIEGNLVVMLIVQRW